MKFTSTKTFVALFSLIALLLCSCEDGHQKWAKYEVVGESFAVFNNFTSLDTVALPQIESHPDYTVYGKGDARVYSFARGAEFVCYRDEDWDLGRNLLIKDGKVIATNVLTMDVKFFLPEDYPDLKMLGSGDFTKDKDSLTLSEYQALLNETCPPKAQARVHFMWGNIIVIVCFIIFAILAFSFGNNDTEKKRISLKGKSTSELVCTLIAFCFFFAIPVTIWLYYYLNPDESFWYITDWGFLGFCVGCFYVFITVAFPCCTVAILPDAFRKTFSSEWKEGLGLLLLSAILIVLSYYFLKLILPQLWEQCGFIIKSVGVIAMLIMLPGAFSTGASKGSPSTVSDGSGNNLDVVSNSDNTHVITSDGKTRHRSADGNYREL